MQYIYIYIYNARILSINSTYETNTKIIYLSRKKLTDVEQKVSEKNMLNSLHSDIKFTAESSDKQLPFSDVLVKKEGFKIETDIYYKPTDSKQYLLFNSCHPKHT